VKRFIDDTPLTNKRMDYAVIDVETTEIKDGEIPKTLFWGYADEKGYKKFKTSAQLAKFIKTETPKVLLHHANFDIIQLLVDGTEEIYPLKSHNNRLITCKWGEHITLNSYSVFPVSLKSIFAAFGFKKTGLDELEKRNYEDCVNGLECFLRLNDLVKHLCYIEPLKKHTVAATGFAAAELVAGKMPKNLGHLEAYRGGRVEVYDTRTFEASKYDIGSSYPRSILECPEESELWEVECKTKDWFCPLFNADETDRLLFPNGTFRSYVYEHNWINYLNVNAEQTKIKILKRIKVDLSWVCKLKELIQTIYDRKEVSDGGIKLACKFLLNSMYGRIGLKGESERCRIMQYEPDGDNITSYPLGKNRFIVFDTVQREPRSNFTFAAWITDNARARLYDGFVRNTALYGDTDSLFTTATEFDGDLGNECGQWKAEGRKTFTALNVKDYKYGGDEVRKGGSRNVSWTIKKFSRGDTAKEVIRERKTGLMKRIVLPDGRTEPLKI
jgi:hypothetical protein